MSYTEELLQWCKDRGLGFRKSMVYLCSALVCAARGASFNKEQLLQLVGESYDKLPDNLKALYTSQPKEPQ